MKVIANMHHDEVEGDYGPMDGVSATCSRCGNIAYAAGDGPGSIRRACLQLRETCPNGEWNFYEPDWLE